MAEDSDMGQSIALSGVDNFRDLGGYTVKGGRIRRGLLFRSGDLSRATEDDLVHLASLGIELIVDLRRPIERQYSVSRPWAGFEGRVITSDIPEDFKDWAVALKTVEVVDAHWFRNSSLKSYREVPFSPRNVSLFGSYLKSCAETTGGILVHCAAGKDRTGMLCAIVQKLLGGSDEDITAEFLKTNDAARIERRIPRLYDWLYSQTGHRVPEDALRVALSVDAVHLEIFFKNIADRSGNLQNYVRDVLGIDDETVRTLRRRLVE
ncbi:tyrosine-protein phosphatase [Agrobacterium tumefaciens]|uniref:Tyrosine-protein phosphatase n=1 Tax=Agrobacterium tumefaciens TaxID=358 RepID=A0AA44FBA3_AGRTU|nr:tyrosine-protein phosphatase [Agrobacterium tumefaciens]NTB87729.1 tyrosine-protein phosphatase [Agrobacterium tumefaciens]NTC32048.1 tyrosine-protein phosphatase [Agrobacterium tumefaciens]